MRPVLNLTVHWTIVLAMRSVLSFLFCESFRSLQGCFYHAAAGSRSFVEASHATREDPKSPAPMIKERILQIKCAALHDGFRATPVPSS